MAGTPVLAGSDNRDHQEGNGLKSLAKVTAELESQLSPFLAEIPTRTAD
ncbi:MAG: hypothetical protein JXQ94_02295 [Maricaulis maris]